MGEPEEEADQRIRFNADVDRRTVLDLQSFLHQHNELIRGFKSALQSLPLDNYVVRIRADKIPTGEHERRYNAPGRFQPP